MNPSTQRSKQLYYVFSGDSLLFHTKLFYSARVIFFADSEWSLCARDSFVPEAR